METYLGVLLLTTLLTWIPGSISQHEAIALKSSLLSNYDKSLRPVKAVSTAVNVDFDISLKQIIELAEKDQEFQINIWLRLYWDDEYLTWNVSEHGGVDFLTIHSSDIWRPDIFLYNNIAKTYGAIEPITDVTVTSAGRVSYLQPAIFTSACPVHISRFPFDKQFHSVEGIALVGFSCLASIVVIRMSYNSPPSRPLPRWLRLLLLRCLARLFCMNTIAEEKHVVPPTKEGVFKVSDHKTIQQDRPNPALGLSLREIVCYSREYSARAREKKEEREDQKEWKMAALVLDRALMFVVALATITVCVVLLR
ncbi:neuronal acetylcholine receptor subunit alpha-3-like [Branchiostoma lanceolatum]|uniref:neuronal acetylcholine receptor subunit alpha-3-like n=1 Tax=Branchiostoma lanceolatum TaxID=7740 RepID=UPI0034522EE9